MGGDSEICVHLRDLRFLRGWVGGSGIRHLISVPHCDLRDSVVIRGHGCREAGRSLRRRCLLGVGKRPAYSRMVPPMSRRRGLQFAAERSCWRAKTIRPDLDDNRGRVENPKSEIQNPQFDWRIYSDATCAGLSVLIPLPLVDIVFETVFRRRIPGAVAKIRLRPVTPIVRRRLGQSVDGPLSLSGCVVVPIAVAKYIVRRLWRKIIYVFAIKDATTALAEYWNRAYLTDHMVRAGHLGPEADTDLALEVYWGVLRSIDPSPLMGLARLMVANVHQVLRLLVRARRLGATEVTRSLGEVFASHWRAAEASFQAAADLYNVRYIDEVRRTRI